jgi:hypothetical protein
MAHCKRPALPFDERVAFSLGEVAAMLGMSVATLYAERARGRLLTIRLAGRRLVTRDQLRQYLAMANRDIGSGDRQMTSI